MRPIDISILIKSVDIAAKFNKNQETALTIQQLHAQQDMQEQTKVNSETVVKAAPVIMNEIAPDKRKKELELRMKNEMRDKEKKLLRKRSRRIDPNRGRWIDFDG